MKFFIDSSDVEEIRKVHETGMLEGVTTNPSLIAKSGRSQEEVVKELCSFVNGSVSSQVTATKAPEMIKQGEEFASWSKNIAVKCPLTVEGLKATKALSEKNIDVNVTLCFSAAQALLAAKVGAKYISPFVGRLDDIGHGGMDLIAQILEVYRNYDYGTEVLVASVRHPGHVLEAALMGAHVVTLPPGVFWKLYEHRLTEVGLQKFLTDYESSKK